jgi:PhnB protein
MATRLNPYISFRDSAKDAMAFYHSVFGGELTSSTFGEFQVSDDPSESDRIMHSMLVSPNGLVLMASDTPNRMEFNPGTNITVSLSGEASDDAELRGYWEKLSAGGDIMMPLETAPWGDSFGQLVDQFGIGWLINIAGAPEA